MSIKAKLNVMHDCLFKLIISVYIIAQSIENYQKHVELNSMIVEYVVQLIIATTETTSQFTPRLNTTDLYLDL